MRKIKEKERSNGMRYCTFCKDCENIRVDATYRNQKQSDIVLACEDHKDLLLEDQPYNAEDVSEADTQTWVRL